MKIPIYVFLGFVLSTSFLFGQQISGTIVDENGYGIPDVEVTNTSSSETVYSDFDGNYTIDAAEGDILNFYAIGFAEQNVTASNSSSLNISMQTPTLKSVVVVGYGTQKKELVTAAYSQIDEEQIMENNPVRLDQAIQGKATGVQVNSSSGAPGASYNIRIRGTTTNGDNRPLLIVDGVNMGREDLSIIDPNDIASIDIIKDAATAIYGVQGANGIIFVTTKSGKFDSKLTVSYAGNYGIQEAANVMNLMDAREYAAYVNEVELSQGKPVLYPNFQSFGEGTDWQAQLFDLAGMTNQSLTVAGGAEKVNYSFSTGYAHQDGIIDPSKSNFKRATARMNLDFKLNDKLGLSTFVLYTNNKYKRIAEGGRGSILYYADNASPLDPVYNGNTIDDPGHGFYYLRGSKEIINPLAALYNTHNRTTVDRISGKLEGNWDITKGLKFTSRFSFNHSNVRDRSYFPISYYGENKVQNTIGRNAATGEFIYDRSGNDIRDVFSTVYESKATYNSFIFENFINYDRSWGKNNFNFLLGTYLQKEPGNLINGFGYMTGVDTWQRAYLGLATAQIPDADYASAPALQSASADFDYRLASVFGRIQYDFDEKYLFSAMLRRDGSSRFGPNNKYAYFPSFSAGWNVDKEEFFNSKFFNSLKVRGSWGVTGNDKLPVNFPFVGLLQSPAEASYTFDNVLYNGSAYGRLPNPDIKWEENTQFNIGFDTEMWKNKIGLTFDYYRKETKNLLISAIPSGITGVGAPGSAPPFINAGVVRNSGVDLGIDYSTVSKKGFGFNAGYTITYVDNKVVRVGNGGYEFGGLFGLSTITSRMQEGFPIGAYFGLVADGVFQNQDEINNAAAQQGAVVGDIRYRDVNGDGVISFGDDSDFEMIGNPIPKYLMSLNLGMNYKNFDFACSFYGSFGNDIVRSYERFEPYNNRLAYYLDRWTGEGSSFEVPRASNAGNNFEFSSFYVEDGSYIRIQNIQIGYNLKDWLSGITSITDARIYFSVNNAYTWTKYLGYTPEVNNASPIGAGVDYGQYPLTRQFITGFTFKF